MEKFALSIKEFCFQHDISRSKFYDLLRNGLAPKMMKLGKRRLISVEAAKEWREQFSTNASLGG
jgi:predicted DNA-binding transcriptional regulator AlpA